MSRNIFQENWITLRDIPDLIKFCHRRKRSLMIFGGAGIGKSQVVKQTADLIFGKRPDNVVDFRLADKEPSDVVGVQIPYTDEKGVTRTVYAIPDFWPTDPNWEGIIFLDELLHAEPYLQKVAFQIMLDRKIGKYEFPAGAVMVGAGNRPDDGTAVTMLEAPLANRMVLAEVMYDTEVFIQDYALPAGMHPSTIGYLSANPTKIENYEEMANVGCPSFCTPRTWVTASDALYDYDAGLITSRMAKVIIQGSLGTAVMNELWAWHTVTRNITPIKDIMSGAVKEYTGKTNAADILWMIGSQGTIWLRKAVENTQYTDDEVVDFTANFLSYLYNNFNKTHKDFVSSIFMSFIRSNAFGPALLSGDCPREKMMAKLISKYPEVMKVVHEFHASFGEKVAEIEE